MRRPPDCSIRRTRRAGALLKMKVGEARLSATVQTIVTQSSVRAVLLGRAVQSDQKIKRKRG